MLLSHNKTIQHATLHTIQHTHSACNYTFQEDLVQSCQIRYHDRDYLASLYRDHPPSLIIATPGPHTVHTRMLFEYGVGYYTGSLTTNNTLLQQFPAEDHCGLRMLVIGGHPYSIRIHPESELIDIINPLSIAKCSKGMISNFQTAMLVIKDPFMYVLDVFLSQQHSNYTQYMTKYNTIQQHHILQHTQQHTSQHTLRRVQITESIHDALLRIANNYNTTHLDVGTIYDEMQNSHIADANVLILSYEAMILSLYNQSITTTTHTTQNTMLQHIYNFTHITIHDTQRYECIPQHFISHTWFQNIVTNVMVARQILQMAGGNELICELNNIFKKKLSGKHQFKTMTLFQDAEFGC